MVVIRALALSAMAVALILADTRAAFSTLEAAPVRWTDDTPDAMIEDAVVRAVAPKATPSAQLAALANIAALAERAQEGAAQKAFERIAAATGAGVDVRGEASLFARMTAADEGTDAGAQADEKLGVVDALAILGPVPRHRRRPRRARRARGRRSLASTTGAHATPGARTRSRGGPSRARLRRREGVPLDVFVFPRKESCTWVETKLMVPSDQKLFVRLAATGQARLVFDGTDLGKDDAVHEAARFDRLAASVQAAPGVARARREGVRGRARRRRPREAARDRRDRRVAAGRDGKRGPRRWSRGPRRDEIEAGDARDAPVRARRDSPRSRPRRRHAETSKAACRRPFSARSAAPTTCEARERRALLASLADGDDRRGSPGDGRVDRAERRQPERLAEPGPRRGGETTRAREPSSIAASSSGTSRPGWLDWAIATLRGAKIDAAADGEAALLVVAGGRRAGDGRAPSGGDAPPRGDRAARTRTRRTRCSRRSRTWRRPTTRASLWRRASGSPQRGEVGSALVLATQARGRDAVLAAARRSFAGGVDDADEAVAVAQTVARTGAHDERARALRAARALGARTAPAVGRARRGDGRGDRRTRCATRPTPAELRRARELDPGEARYRAELALRTRTPGCRRARPHDDEKYLGPVADDPRAPAGQRRRGGAAGLAEAPDVADRELHWLRAVIMHPDNRVSQLIHYAREIVIAPRTEDELFEDVPAEGDLTEILRARVHRKDGGTAFPVEEPNDDARPRIRWPELTTGDVVEVAFRSWTAGPVGGRGDAPFFPRLRRRAVDPPAPLQRGRSSSRRADHPLYVDVLNGKADRRDEKDAGAHARRAPRLGQAAQRPRRAARAAAERGDPHPRALDVQGLERVPHVVRRGRARLHRARRAGPRARRRAHQGQDDARREARRRIFDFVADDIRYVNYVSGEWWLPNRPQQLLARREGDCDDKAMLLITLLKAVGIDAQEVMVQTRQTAQPSLLRAQNAAIPLFDHGIAFLPGPNGGTYLDATSPQSRLGPLPSMDARAVALRMDGPPEIVELPASSPDDHGVDATWTITLKPDGTGRSRGRGARHGRRRVLAAHEPDGARTARAVGRGAPRRRLVPDGGGRQESRLQGRPPARRGDDALASALERPRAPRGPGARRAALAAQTTASQLAPLVKRTLPVGCLPYVAPRNETRTIRIVAPAGYAFEALPPGGDENGGAVRPRAPRGRARPARSAGDPRQAHGRLRSKRDPRREVRHVARVGSARRRPDAQERAPRPRGDDRQERPMTKLLPSLFVLSLLACGGPPARVPQGASIALPHAFAEAFRVDATGRSARGDEGVPRDRAAGRARRRRSDGRSRRSRPRSTRSRCARCQSLGDAARDAALANRTREGASIVQELTRAANDARGPFARGLVARGARRPGPATRRRGGRAEAA